MKALRIFILGVCSGFSGAAAVQCGGTQEPPIPPVPQAAPPPAAPVPAPPVLSSADAGSAPVAKVDLEPALLRLGHKLGARHPEPHHTWRLVDGLYWQIEGPPGEVPEMAAGSKCPAGMVSVSGEYLLDPSGKDTEALREWQDATCTKWRGGKKLVCEQFDEKRWAAMRKRAKRKPIDVCVDRYEYPNAKGEYPMVVVSHTEATAVCKKQGKRLCTESEWTFACEGPDATPYPYGFVRDASKCTIDVTTQAIADDALWPRNTERAIRAVDKAFHGTPSGSKAACKSPFGVYDMTGNLDEWTQTVRPGVGYPSILKGGFWSKVRARCRPQTRAHGPIFVTYETGFRCCADPR